MLRRQVGPGRTALSFRSGTTNSKVTPMAGSTHIFCSTFNSSVCGLTQVRLSYWDRDTHHCHACAILRRSFDYCDDGTFMPPSEFIQSEPKARRTMRSLRQSSPPISP